AVVSLPNKHRVLGSLLVNSVCESINWNKDTQKIVRASLNNIRRAFLARTRELESAGQLRKGMKAELAADVLMNALFGLRVNARNGRPPKQLGELVAHTLDSLKK